MTNYSLAAAILTMLLVGAVPVVAQQSDSTNQHKTRQATATLGLPVYEKLQRAITLNQQGDTVGALAILDKLKAKQDRYNGHERARLWSAYAYVYYQQGKYTITETAYQKALAEQGSPEGLRNELMYSLAQVYFLQEKYNQALMLVERWLKRVPEPGNEASVFVGQVYYQQQQYRHALPFVRRAVSSYQAQSKLVPEHWYLLLNAVYYELKDYRNSFKVTLALINDYPKKTYYTQLSGLYGEQGQEFEQFSVQQAMSDAGLLEKSSEWSGFGQFLLHNERPFRAAQLLETGFDKGILERNEKHLKLLANAWMLAREDKRALKPLAAAANLSDDGELYVMLAQAYLNLERWQDAAKAVTKALLRGGLKRADRAHLMAGMARFNLDQFDDAIESFRKAGKDKRSQKIATQWVAYVKAEQARMLSLL